LEWHRKEGVLLIKVYENQLERALKALKRQLAKEGLLKELKRRSFYEKPCVKRKRKQKEARKKRLKAQRMVSPLIP
jgi:small subunit ribosomal protein S21